MTRIKRIEKSKGNSQALEQIAEDYLHLGQDTAGALDTVTKKRHAELLQLADGKAPQAINLNQKASTSASSSTRRRQKW